MFKKRLKGLLAMVLAGSLALTALPLTASATINDNISIADEGGGTVYQYDIGATGFESGVLDSSQLLTAGNLWAIYSEVGGNNSIECVAGNELFTKLKAMKVDPSPTYSNVEIKSEHRILVTTDDPNTNVIDTNSADTVSEFPKTIDISSYNTALQDVVSWTAWYGVESDDKVDSGNLTQSATNSISADGTSISVSAETVNGLYNNGSLGAYGSFHSGITIIQLNQKYKTFEIPVYDGWGEATNQKISVTQTNTDSALKDLNGAALKGKYVLLYDGVEYNNSYNYIKTKSDLWSVIGVVAAEKGTFDVSKAKLVRYVYYDAVGGYFTSVDLLNEVANNSGINYLNERKTSGSIWKLYCEVIGPTGLYTYPNKFVYGDSFDAEIKEFLNEYDCDTVYLSNKKELHITATDPSTQVNPNGGFKLEITEDVKQYITIDTDKQYPVKVSDLATKLTAEIRPTAGMKYNKDEWELWPCYTSTGLITMERKATVADPAADIGITHYELALEQKRNDLLVYFKQVAIAPSLEVTAPVVGIAPSTGATIKDTIGGYTVTSVSWPLTSEDMFEAGKQYTVTVTLKPDAGLAFTEDTSVTINGEAPTAKNLNQDDGTLTVSYTFDELKDPWLDIENKLDDTLNGENPTIKVPSDNPTIPESVLEDIKASGKEVTIIYPNSNEETGNYKWIIDGSTITDIPKGGVNLSIQNKNGEDWATVINQINGHTYKMQISIAYSGELGFHAYLEIDLTQAMGDLDENGTYYANLYLKDGNTPVWKTCSQFSKNSEGKWIAQLEFTHASEWIITINDKDMDPAKNDSSSGSSGSSGSGSFRPSGSSTTTVSSTPMFGGKAMSWSDIVAEFKKLPIGSEVTIELNGITNVPFEVINVIGERKLKTTFKFDSVRSWKLNGAEITAPAAADLSIIAINRLKTDSLRGISGYQFTMNDTNIPTGIEIAFKTEYAGQFANLYKVVDGKMTFVTCAKVGADGKVILPDIAEKGDYVAMLSELSDVLGDMNNDGVLDQKDASAILKDIVGLEQGKNPLMADFNGDGAIDQKDASAILKSIVGLA